FAAANDYYKRLRGLAERGEGFTEAVIIGETAGAPLGDRYLFDAAGASLLHVADQPNWEIARANLTPLDVRAKPATRSGIAYLPSLPRFTIFLVGGGHVGQAVAKLASEVGFDIWVLDDRDR